MLELIKQVTGLSQTVFRRALFYAAGEAFLMGAPLPVLYMVLLALLDQSVSFGKMFFLLFLIIASFIMQTFCSIRAHVQLCEFSFDVGARLRLALGEHLRKLPLGVVRGLDSGNSVESMLVDVSNIELTLSHVYNKLFSCIAIPTVIILVIACMNPWIALLLTITIPVAVLVLLAMRKAMSSKGDKMLVARRDATSRIIEYIQGINTFKTLNMTGTAFTRLEGTLKELARRSISFETLIWPVAELYALTASCGIVLVMFMAGSDAVEGSMALSQFFLFILVSLRFYIPIAAIGPYFATLSYLRNSSDNIKKVLAIPEQSGGSATFPEYFSDIVFDNVHFSHGDRQILKGVSFRAAKGTVTGLVGPSGAGKTTLTYLLTRFWDINSGRLLIGGQDVRSFHPDTLLRNVSMVMQDTFLFNDTVAANMRMAKPEASMDEIVAAAKAASCHEFILKLPQGYDSQVGEGGALLSGGERKRISIARAILKDSPIIILDEATASLDPENEHLVQQGLSALADGRTLFVIAHRLSTVRNADQILFLENGAIEESGTFDDLLAQKGRFYQFLNMQQQVSQWKISR